MKRIGFMLAGAFLLLCLVLFLRKTGPDYSECPCGFVAQEECFSVRDANHYIWNIIVEEREPGLCKYLMDDRLKENCVINANEYNYSLMFMENPPPSQKNEVEET